VKRNLITAVILLFVTATSIAIPYEIFVRPLARRRDIKELVASQVNADPALASEVCGTPVRSLLWPTPKTEDLRYGDWPWAKVSILSSWSPVFPLDGSATARVSGVGTDDNRKAITGMHAARISFSYHCRWEDNGRSMNFYCSMTAPPKVERE
jgi:hypothetical protein